MRDPRQRLYDVLDAIQRIEKYAAAGKSAFVNDELIQTWILHHLVIIGEACTTLPEEIRARLSGVPWRKIVGMRNILVHHYFGIDYEIVWSVVENDLPDMKRKIKDIMRDLEHLNFLEC